MSAPEVGAPWDARCAPWNALMLVESLHGDDHHIFRAVAMHALGRRDVIAYLVRNDVDMSAIDYDVRRFIGYEAPEEPERLTPHEARALRLACIFGTPDPTPPEIASALEKIRAIEAR